MLRSPIIVTVGHSDHGKTSLLDRIRGTAVTKQEPGALTQHTGASYVPLSVIEKFSGKQLQKFDIKLEVPGLLFIDTPGHKAFIGMRRRGGAVSDLAILVVDITEGFQEQTDESLSILREFKTPFVVAATKIDKLKGWRQIANASFIDSFAQQRDDVKEDVENFVYKLVNQLAERGLNAEQFDRIENFTKQIAIVPISSVSGEGVSDLLMVLSGLAQQFLKDRLTISNIARGSVLEVKDVKGLGTTIDVILYDGKIGKGWFAVIGGNEIIATKIKALLRPRNLQELRIEKQFEAVNEVSAAAGIKISAPDLEKIVAGSPIIFVQKENEIEKAKEMVKTELSELQFEKSQDGVGIKADTLGSLEAMIKILQENDVPIRFAEVGTVNKQDVVETQNVNDRFRKVVLAFNVKVPEEIETLAKDLKIKIFRNEIIYQLIEEYKTWVEKERERELEEKLQLVTRPCELKILKGTVFRQSNPAVFGVEILRGVLKPGAALQRGQKTVDRVKEIQKESKSIMEAKKGDRVAISLENVTVGRQVKEGDTLSVVITDNMKKILKEVWSKLGEDEKEMLPNLF